MSTGERGKTGETGGTGKQGAIGERGGLGERGDTGQRGVGGERGPQGDHGQTGEIGLTGDIGERGDRGERGQRGDTGETGAQGKSTLLSRNIAVSYLLLAVVAAFVLAVMGYAVVQNRNLIQRVDEQQRQIAMLASSTHDSLCSFRLNLERAVASSQQYLDDVESGKRPRIQGITDADIQASITRQQNTIDSLSGLNDC